MILLRSKLKMKFIRELGLHDIRRASPQKRHHHKFLQLTFVLQGTLSWRFADGGTIRFHGGEYCITRPGAEFDVIHEALSPCRLVWLLLDFSAGSGGTGSLFSANALKKMKKSLMRMENPVRKTSPQIEFYLNEIWDMTGDNVLKSDIMDMDKIRVCLCGMLVEAVKMENENTDDAFSDKRLESQVRAMILRDPAANPGTEDIAAHFGISAGLFGKRFRNETGISPADFVRRVKLEESIRRLKESSRSITEIAYALGFSSSQHFATLFKKYFGKSPKLFRS